MVPKVTHWEYLVFSVPYTTFRHHRAIARCKHLHTGPKRLRSYSENLSHFQGREISHLQRNFCTSGGCGTQMTASEMAIKCQAIGCILMGFLFSGETSRCVNKRGAGEN